MISFDKGEFDYEPYPVAYLSPFIEAATYTEMMANWPDFALFKPMPDLGKKYSLSETNNTAHYSKVVRSVPVWNRFHDLVKSEKFVEDTLAYFQRSNIDLGLKKRRVVSHRSGRHASLLARINRVSELSARFEFSLMDGNGGSILPHTDAPNKLITMVISMVAPGEWQPEWGGGTEICLPKDRTRLYNHMNKYMQFDDVETVKAFPFEPNQNIIFIKTYNSWHQVSPIRGGENAPMRRTLTINIESKV
jgi:hypothetical protein